MKNNRLINNFLDLVKIDSPTGEEQEISRYLVNFLKENKLVNVVKQDKLGNIYGYLKGRGDSIFLSAHMDTVEPGRGVNPKIKNDYITSDGTTVLGADDKVGLSVILETL